MPAETGRREGLESNSDSHLNLLHLRHELGWDPGAAKAYHLLEPPPRVDAHHSRHDRHVDSPLAKNIRRWRRRQRKGFPTNNQAASRSIRHAPSRPTRVTIRGEHHPPGEKLYKTDTTAQRDGERRKKKETSFVVAGKAPARCDTRPRRRQKESPSKTPPPYSPRKHFPRELLRSKTFTQATSPPKKRPC